jgi:hypothetical protein
MSLQESYGFDAFFQELVQQWPEVQLSFRRAGNRLFVTAGALNALAPAISREGELAGSTVRRAVADLHARLVVRGNTPGLQLRPTAQLNTHHARVLELVTALRDAQNELDELEARADELASVFEQYLTGADPNLLNEAIEAGKELPLIPEKMSDLEDRIEGLSDELNELDPNGEVEADLVVSGRL